MKVWISTDSLKEQGLTLKEFGVLLYYMDKGTGDIAPTITDKLWRMNLLTKEVGGYLFNGFKARAINEWFEADERLPKKPKRDYAKLADQLRAIYPEGKKEGTSYMWKDSTLGIAKKLKSLDDMCAEYGLPLYTDEEAIEATQRYVASFNGIYRYMQLLKYFILKQSNEKGEKASQLLSFIQNKHAGTVEEPTFDFGEMI